MEKAKRYLVFLIGLFINSLGVSLIHPKGGFGHLPISSIPYVIQPELSPHTGRVHNYLQSAADLSAAGYPTTEFQARTLAESVSIAFGYFIDLCMALLAFVQPQAYPIKVVDLLIGCVILGFGVFLEVIADVVMLPGESFVRAVVFRWKAEFGITKVVFDVSMTVIAAVLSFCIPGPA